MTDNFLTAFIIVGVLALAAEFYFAPIIEDNHHVDDEPE